jgi:hypothetical protein
MRVRKAKNNNMDINKIIIYYFYYLTFALVKLHEINDFYLYIIYFVMFGNICCRDFIYEILLFTI